MKPPFAFGCGGIIDAALPGFRVLKLPHLKNPDLQWVRPHNTSEIKLGGESLVFAWPVPQSFPFISTNTQAT
ncbi:MAG: hypothetical protein K6G94_06740 [Kiritimatiellae bacterium]|nr:hypothetical protein [Kiritimatiellia bacterium]